MRTGFIKYVLAASVLLATLVPQFLFAAQMTVSPSTREVFQGEDFLTSIFVNTEGERDNVFSAKIVYPSNLLTVKEIREGNSVINFWVDQPTDSGGAVIFSGMTPGGYLGTNGLLLSVVFTATHAGTGNITLADGLVLKNDGKGTAAKLTVDGGTVRVDPPRFIKAQPIPPLPDTTPPEPFTPEIGRSATMYNNQWFLVFSTDDKGSGIDHYEVQEVRPGILGLLSPWVPSKSPYLLHDQSLRSSFNVRAIDKTGNIRTEHVPAPHALVWYKNPVTWIWILVLFALALLVKNILWHSSQRK